MSLGEATTYRKLRPVAAIGEFKPARDIGAPPELRWLPLASLVVDDRYQRAIGRQGRPNIIRILESFRWSKFSPLVVTPIEEDLFAIIDGQHHATSAFMHPEITMAPCMVIKVTPAEAAECFAAINGAVTSMTSGQIWKARVTAGDLLAVAVNKVLAAADASILAYRNPGQPYKIGQTLAVRTCEEAFKKYGADVLMIALQAVTQTGDGNPGLLVAPVIWELCEIVAKIDVFQKRPSLLFDLMDEVNLGDVLAKTASRAKLERRGHRKVLGEVLAGYLANALGPPERVPA